MKLSEPSSTWERSSRGTNRSPRTARSRSSSVFSNGQGFPSRWSFAEDCIRQFNGTPTSTGTKVAKGGDRRSERSPTIEEPPGHSGVPADYKSVENSGLPDINLQISNRTASRIPVYAESLGSFALIRSLILEYGEDKSPLKLPHRFRASHEAMGAILATSTQADAARFLRTSDAGFTRSATKRTARLMLAYRSPERIGKNDAATRA